MTEKPIIFNADMVQAILKGIKTQTRKVIKPELFLPGGSGFYFQQNQFSFYNSDGQITYYRSCPYGKPGDYLWVRETWQYGREGGIIYRADRSEECRRWKPSIHLRKKDSRITLEITEIRVQQIQQISYQDIRAEGIEKDLLDVSRDMQRNFKELWDSINAKRGYSWQDNPWVWIISFKVLKEQ